VADIHVIAPVGWFDDIHSTPTRSSSLLVVDIDLGTASGLLAFTEIILEQGEFPNWEKIILGLGRS